MPDTKKGIYWHPVLLFFMAIVASIEFIRMSLFFSFLQSFMKNLHYNTAAIGLVISINFLADNLVKSAAGWLADHRGPWMVLVSGCLFVFAGLLLIINFHQSFLVLILSALLIGVGAAPTWPASISGALQIAGEEKRATMISMISVVWLIGGGTGTVLMGFLVDSNLLTRLHLHIISAYRTGFLLLLGVTIFAVLISILGWFEWRRVPHIKVTLDSERPKPSIKEALKRLWTIKGLIPGMFIQTFALGMLMPNLIPYATGRLGLTEAQYSILLLIGGVVVVAFMIPVGHLADRLGTKGFLVSGFSLAAVSIFAMVTYATRENIWYIVGFFGLAYALIQPAWNALMAASIPPEQRGVLMGLFMSIEGMGFGVGPVVGGLLGVATVNLPLIGKIGSTLPFYVTAVLLAFMAFVYLLNPFHNYHFERNE